MTIEFGPPVDTQRRRILVATEDTLTTAMAGAAIRAWNIAATLAEHHDVRLVSTTEATVEGAGFRVDQVDRDSLREAVAWADVFITQGWVLARDPKLAGSDRIMVIDLYDPMHLEQLEQGHEAGDHRGRIKAVADVTAVLNQQLVRGDFFLCASDKQRAFWLGQMAAVGRVNPVTYDHDPSLGSLLAVVPFGLPREPPVRTGPGARGVITGISQDDRLLLWGGGIYNWFDPLTLLRAVNRLRESVSDVRLLFLGLRHPNPAIPEMRIATAARALSAELNLTDRYVFFNEGWVPYEQRHNYLLDADIGVSTHLHHVETEFSFRTRLLDYIWAGLPIVTTGGDALGDLVEAEGLGVAVPPNDDVALAAALERLLTDEQFAASCRKGLTLTAEQLRWEQVLQPLLEFCRAPHAAPDRLDPTQLRALGPRVGLGRMSGPGRDVRLLREYLAEGGWRLAARRARSRVVGKVRRG